MTANSYPRMYLTTSEIHPEIPALCIDFGMYPKAHYVGEVAFPDDLPIQIYTQEDDDGNIGNILVDYPDKFLKYDEVNDLEINGYNIKQLVAKGVEKYVKDLAEWDYEWDG